MSKKKVADKKASAKKKKPRPVSARAGGGHQGGLLTGPGNGLGR